MERTHHMLRDVSIIALDHVIEYGHVCRRETWEQAANELTRRMKPERASTDDLVWKFIDWCRQQAAIAGGGGEKVTHEPKFGCRWAVIRPQQEEDPPIMCEDDDGAFVLYEHYARLHAEVVRLKTMSTVEMMCKNQNVNAHVREWEARCLKAEAEVATLTEQIASYQDLLEYTQETLRHEREQLQQVRKRVTWTGEKPTQPGWYWWRLFNCEDEIIRLQELPDGLGWIFMSVSNGTNVRYVDDMAGYWAGPLTTPQEAGR